MRPITTVMGRPTRMGSSLCTVWHADPPASGAGCAASSDDQGASCRCKKRGKIGASMRTKLFAVVVLAVLTVAGGGVSSAFAQSNPSLGEVALKEAARRKAMKSSVKVLSNADLPKLPAKPAADAGTAAGTAK